MCDIKDVGHPVGEKLGELGVVNFLALAIYFNREGSVAVWDDVGSGHFMRLLFNFDLPSLVGRELIL